MIFLSYNVYKYMYFAQEDISGNWPMSITERDVITDMVCKTQINIQPVIDVQSSNPCPISTSQISVPQI